MCWTRQIHFHVIKRSHQSSYAYGIAAEALRQSNRTDLSNRIRCGIDWKTHHERVCFVSEIQAAPSVPSAELTSEFQFILHRTRHQCPDCTKDFVHIHHLIRHQRSAHEEIRHQCAKCSKSYSRIENLRCHERTAHATDLGAGFPCKFCDKQFLREGNLINHEEMCRKKDNSSAPATKWELLSTDGDTGIEKGKECELDADEAGDSEKCRSVGQNKKQKLAAEMDFGKNWELLPTDHGFDEGHEYPREATTVVADDFDDRRTGGKKKSRDKPLEGATGDELLDRDAKLNNFGRKNAINENQVKQSTAKVEPGMPVKLAKFCAECGTKFELHTEKFCMECGEPRKTVKWKSSMFSAPTVATQIDSICIKWTLVSIQRVYWSLISSIFIIYYCEYAVCSRFVLISIKMFVCRFKRIMPESHVFHSHTVTSMLHRRAIDFTTQNAPSRSKMFLPSLSGLTGCLRRASTSSRTPTANLMQWSAVYWTHRPVFGSINGSFVSEVCRES